MDRIEYDVTGADSGPSSVTRLVQDGHYDPSATRSVLTATGGRRRER